VAVFGFRACGLLALLILSTASAAVPDGRALYDKACAACHDHPDTTRAPPLANLRGMRYGSIHYALTEGKMQV